MHFSFNRFMCRLGAHASELLDTSGQWMGLPKQLESDAGHAKPKLVPATENVFLLEMRSRSRHNLPGAGAAEAFCPEPEPT